MLQLNLSYVNPVKCFHHLFFDSVHRQRPGIFRFHIFHDDFTVFAVLKICPVFTDQDSVMNHFKFGLQI